MLIIVVVVRLDIKKIIKKFARLVAVCVLVSGASCDAVERFSV